MTNQFYPFGPSPGGSGQAYLPYDLEINEAYPGIIFLPTEPNGVYVVYREVSGCSWWVLNADYNDTDAQWEQVSPQNAATPAYALEQCSNGTLTRYIANATNTPGTAVNWIAVWQIDANGNQTIEPVTNTLSSQIPENVKPVWNGGTSVSMSARQVNVTDTSSAAASYIDQLDVNSTTVWQVRKDGTLTVGIIPFARVTGFVIPSGATINNATFTGTSTFNGPADFNDGIAVTGGETVDNLTVTGNETVGGTLGVTGNETVGGTLGVTGNTTLSNLTVTGNETVDGNLGVDGTTTLSNVVITGTVAGSNIGLYSRLVSISIGPTGSSPTYPYTSQVVNPIGSVPAALQTSAHTFNIQYTFDLYARAAGTFTLQDTSGTSAIQAAWDNTSTSTSTYNVAAATHTIVTLSFQVPGNKLNYTTLMSTVPGPSNQSNGSGTYNQLYGNCSLLVVQTS